MESPILTLAQEWERLESIVLAEAGVGEVQRREMQRSFYAGALVILLDAQVLANTEIPEEEATKVLNGLNTEALDFFRAIGSQTA